jgi:hypothetical protein
VLAVLVVKRRRRRRVLVVKRRMSQRCMMLFVELKAPVSAKLLLRLAPLITLPPPLPLPHLPQWPLLLPLIHLPLIETERQRLPDTQTDGQTDRPKRECVHGGGRGQTKRNPTQHAV